MLGPDVLFARQELSLSHLTEIQQAQLALEYLDVADGISFAELRSALGRTHNVRLLLDSAASDLKSRMVFRLSVEGSDPQAAIADLPIELLKGPDGYYCSNESSVSVELAKLRVNSTSIAQGASNCGQGQACYSPNMLIPKALSAEPSVWIMNKATAQSNWSVDLFNRSSGIASYVYIDPLRSYNYIAVSDPNWDRIVCAEDTIAGAPGSGIMAFGSTGTGINPNEFRAPRGICVRGSYLYTADCYNNRIVKHTFVNNQFVQSTVYSGYDKPTDVDIRDATLYSAGYLVIANAGANTVELTNGLSVTAVGCGSGPSAFSYPVSVAVGRDPLTGRTNNRVYVIDAGNRRVVGFTVGKNGFGNNEAVEWLCYEFPLIGTLPELRSVDVDYLGYVYVTDAATGYVYKFDRNLYPLAYWGGLGTGDGELNYPEGIEFVQGTRWIQEAETVELKELGDVLITERYTDVTGVRRFYLGADLVDFQAAWIPDNPNYPEASDHIAFSFFLPNPALVTTDIFRYDGSDWVLVENVYTDRPFAHGDVPHRFSTRQAPNGTYKVVVAAKSLYGVQSVTSEGECAVAHQGITDRPPVITRIYFDRFIPDCLVGDGRTDSIRVEAADPDPGQQPILWEFWLRHPSTDWANQVRLTASADPDHFESYYPATELLINTLDPLTAGGARDATPVISANPATAMLQLVVRCQSNGLYSDSVILRLAMASDTCVCLNEPPVLERARFDQFQEYCAGSAEIDTLRISAHDPDGHPVYFHLHSETQAPGGGTFWFENGAKATQDTVVMDTAIPYLAGVYVTEPGTDVVTVTVDDLLTCDAELPEHTFNISVELDRDACNGAPSFASALGLKGADMSCVVDGTLWLAGGQSSDPEQDTLMCHWTSVLGHFEFPEGETTKDTVVAHSDSLWYKAECPLNGSGNPVTGTETISLTVTDPLGKNATSVRTFSIYPTASACPGSDPGCPFLYVWDGSRWVFENSILAASEAKTDRRDTLYDYYLLSPKVSDEDGSVRIRIAEHENEVSYIDEVALYAVAAPKDSRVSIDNAGNVYALVEPLYPSSIVDQTGAEWKDVLNRFDEQKLESTGPGYLILTYDPFAEGAKDGGNVSQSRDAYGAQPAGLGPPGGDPEDPGKEEDPNKVAAETTGDSGDSTSGALQVEVSTQRGQWSLVDKIYPRIGGGTRFVDFSPWVPSSDRPFQVRYSWERAYKTDAIRLYRHERLDATGIQGLDLRAANHSSTGSVDAALRATDGILGELDPGDELELVYVTTASPVERTVTRYLLKVRGHYVTSASRSASNPNSVLPSQFSLGQNYPNPFNPSTLIAFELPRDGHVTLQVFNVLGQLVRNLIQEDRQAGTHKTSWDGRDDHGQQVGSGIYFYRLSSAGFESTRKMLLLR